MASSIFFYIFWIRKKTCLVPKSALLAFSALRFFTQTVIPQKGILIWFFDVSGEKTGKELSGEGNALLGHRVFGTMRLRVFQGKFLEALKYIFSF